MMENNLFDQMAKKYDSEKQIQLAKVITSEIKSQLEDSKNKSLIDYGCGTGLIGLELVNDLKSITFVDQSSSMLKVVENKLKAKEIKHANLLQADFVIDQAEIKADYIILSLVLLHIPNTEAILKALYDILNREGELIIVDFDKHDEIDHPKVHNGFTHQFMKDKLAEAGFTQTDIRTFHHGENLFMNKDASIFIATSKKQ